MYSKSFSLILPLFVSTVTSFCIPPPTRFISTSAPLRSAVDQLTTKAVESSGEVESISSPEPKKKVSVFVGNLPNDLSKQDLQQVFAEKLGTSFDNFRLGINRDTGESRGFGHFDFADKEKADQAIASLAGLKISDRVIKVDLSDNKRDGKKSDQGRTPMSPSEVIELSIQFFVLLLLLLLFLNFLRRTLFSSVISTSQPLKATYNHYAKMWSGLERPEESVSVLIS